MKILLLILVFVLTGCAAQVGYLDKAEMQIKNRQWEPAYRFLEDGFTSNRPEIKKRAFALFEEYPEIRSAALSTFSLDSLSKSRIRYGARIAWEIETNRLNLYMQAANPADYPVAKTNMERSFADVSMTEAERMRLAQLSEVQRQKLVDEMRATDQAEKVHRMEKRLQAQRLLEVAENNARFMCKDRPECDKVFSLTQIFIVGNADMKIQVANDTVIETYNATEGMKISMKAIKMPRAGSTAEILLSVDCKDEGNESFKDLCDLKSLSVYSEFPRYIKNNLIR